MLSSKFKQKIIPQMIERFGYKNPFAVPKIEKIVINVGFGKRVVKESGEKRERIIKNITENLALITGQKPVLTKARKSISTFSLRKGLPIGAKVTLRGQRMLDFFEKLIKVVLPRTRDFQGIKRSAVDEKGNLTIGIKDYTAFPEALPPQNQEDIFGLEVCITTTASNKKEGLQLLQLIGVPFEKYGS